MDWSKIKHFERKEWEPGADRVHTRLIETMDRIRDYCDHPIIIHEAFASIGHSKNSYHYSGMAVDFHIKDYSLLEQFLIAERFGFGGIGIYPYWNSPGLHCDLRHINYKTITMAARWWRNAAGEYHELDTDSFKKCLGLMYGWESNDWSWGEQFLMKATKQ